MQEKLIMLKAKFERQPVNIQREILAMPLSSKKVKTYLYKGVVPEKKIKKRCGSIVLLGVIGVAF
jgi:hypothetical protein